MTRAAWPLVSAAQMRALDRHTIEDLGVPGEVLMESAGRAVVAAVLARLAPGTGRHLSRRDAASLRDQVGEAGEAAHLPLVGGWACFLRSSRQSTEATTVSA